MTRPLSSALRAPGPPPARRALLTAAVFVLAFALLVPVFFRLPVLYDVDSYYHLAAARAYAEAGTLHELPWARFSLMHDGFGDKELLFHQILRPFAAWMDPTDGGRLALALFDAALAALLAWLGIELAASSWGALLPLGLVLASAEYDWRLVRLRPELLALVLFLLAVAAAGRRRYRLLGVVAFVFALSYTAFHALLGLAGLLFLWRGWARRRWDWGLVAYPLAGVALGLVVHPQFPANLHVWWVQNVDFFRFKGTLDVGTEIRARPTDQMLFDNLGWWPALVALGLAARPLAGGLGEPGGRSPAQAEDDEATADAFTLAAVVFGFLYLLMGRFVLYSLPFVTLAVLAELRRRGLSPGAWMHLPGGRFRRARVPLAAILILCAAASLPRVWRLVSRLPGPADAAPRARETAWRDLGRAMPDGARVAAPWGSTEAYVLFAPQARYLNVLDPVFMAVPFPRIYTLQRAVFEGHEPDVPLVVTTSLESEYLAQSNALGSRLLARRLAHDPRVEEVFDERDLLVRFVPGRNGRFYLDWEARPEGPGEPWRTYPRAATAEGRAIEGYVDAHRLVGGERCAELRHRFRLTRPERRRLELAPSGPTTLSLDGRVVVKVAGDPGAVLGEGVEVPLELAAGAHELAVTSCPARRRPERNGFYLLDRAEPDSSTLGRDRARPLQPFGAPRERNPR